MSHTMSIFQKQKTSLCPTNGRQTVGDGAFSTDSAPNVIASCHLGGNIYYYSTTFSGGPEVHNERGGFDVPNEKCPPDRGSSDCVTGSQASMFRTSSFTNRSTSSSSPNPKFPNSIVYPPTPPLENSTTISDYISSATSPQDIPGRVRNVPAIHNIATPPLTPDSDGDDDDDESMNGSDRKESDDALDFLLTIFPRDGLDALPYARSVVISAPHMGATFDGVVLELPGKPKALYVDGKAAQSINLRESIVALLDLADECFRCSALVIALDRSSPFLGEILHSFMYVGGTVVTKPPFYVDPTYVFVGVEI